MPDPTFTITAYLNLVANRMQKAADSGDKCEFKRLAYSFIDEMRDLIRGIGAQSIESYPRPPNIQELEEENIELRKRIEELELELIDPDGRR